MTEKEIAAIIDDFDGGTSTIVHEDGSYNTACNTCLSPGLALSIFEYRTRRQTRRCGMEVV